MILYISQIRFDRFQLNKYSLQNVRYLFTNHILRTNKNCPRKGTRNSTYSGTGSLSRSFFIRHDEVRRGPVAVAISGHAAQPALHAEVMWREVSLTILCEPRFDTDAGASDVPCKFIGWLTRARLPGDTEDLFIKFCCKTFLNLYFRVYRYILRSYFRFNV